MRGIDVADLPACTRSSWSLGTPSVALLEAVVLGQPTPTSWYLYVFVANLYPSVLNQFSRVHEHFDHVLQSQPDQQASFWYLRWASIKHPA